MGKYEDTKYLILKKSRKNYSCKICEKEIIPNEEYYRETLGLINPGPNITLYPYCINCGKKSPLQIREK